MAFVIKTKMQVFMNMVYFLIAGYGKWYVNIGIKIVWKQNAAYIFYIHKLFISFLLIISPVLNIFQLLISCYKSVIELFLQLQLCLQLIFVNFAMLLWPLSSRVYFATGACCGFTGDAQKIRNVKWTRKLTDVCLEMESPLNGSVQPACDKMLNV